MNTQLEKLFNQYNLSQKDRYEIMQIYTLLSNTKKQNVLQNFAVLAARLHKIENDLQEERELLMWNALRNIEDTIELVKKELMSSEYQNQLDSLKKELK